MGKKQPARAKISFLAISQFNVNFVKGCGFLSARTENMRRENGYALSRRMFSLSARTENMRRENGYALSRRMFRKYLRQNLQIGWMLPAWVS